MKSPDSMLQVPEKTYILTAAPPASKLNILHSWEYDFSFFTFMTQMEPFALTSVYKARLIRRRKFPLSLIGHTHMIKTVSMPAPLPQNFHSHFKQFPHRLFIFHISPTLNGTIISFIWNHKTWRIKKKQINPPRGEKEDGSCQLLNCRIGLASKHRFLFQQLSRFEEMNGYDSESWNKMQNYANALKTDILREKLSKAGGINNAGWKGNILKLRVGYPAFIIHSGKISSIMMWKPQFPLFVDHAGLKGVQGRRAAGWRTECSAQRRGLRVLKPVTGWLGPTA